MHFVEYLVLENYAPFQLYNVAQVIWTAIAIMNL